MATLPTLHTVFLRPSTQRGFGIVEVLVALLLVAVGVVGLARFQGVFLRDGNMAKSRAVASQLAREKLDDLKSFTQLDTGAAGVFGYGEIGTNTGGSECTTTAPNPPCAAIGTLRLASGTVAVSNTSYNRSWTASPRYYCAVNAAPSATNCAGAAAKSRPDFLALRVTISWTDQDNVAQTLSLDDVAASIDPNSVASSLISGTTAASPTVPYVPGLAPNVIAIDIGGSQRKETTNPTPTLNRSGQNIINTIARYETIRFSSASNTITREEFATLNCLCTQSGSGQGYNMQNLLVAKRVGAPADRNQAPECAACCRDHHDDQTCNPATSAGKNSCYDPFRPATDYAGNDHNHYNANGEVANATGATYREACRMKRVDGTFRVDQDWNLTTLSLIPESFFFSNNAVNTTNVTSYSNYVRDFVAAYLSGGTAPSKPWQVASNINLNANRPYAARALYIDYIDDTAKAAFAARIARNDATVFQEIPFYEVNLTKLAQWNTANAVVATVRNDQLVSELSGQNLYTRGVATGRSFGVTNINTSTTAGNAGVINEFITTDPHDGSVVISDTHEVTVPGANPVISGSISPVVSTVVLTASNGGSCSYATGNYTCSVPFNWDGTITPAAEGYIFTPASRTYADQIVSLPSQNFTSAVSTTQYTISGTVTPALSVVSFAATTGASCTYTSSSGAYSCSVPEGWTGTVTPSASGYSFAPGQRSYTNVAGNQSTQDFAATVVVSSFTISGTITPGPTTVTFAVSPGGSCSYAGSGTGGYSCTVPSGWSGSITPSASARVFTPTGRSYTNVTANVTAQDYSDQVASFIISGSIAPHTSGTTVSATNGGGPCTYTAGSPNGSYSCTVPNLWSGSVIPTATNKTFTPSNRAYTNVTSDQLVENYGVTDVASISFTLSGTISPMGNNRTASITATSGASCPTPTKAVASCNNNCTFNYVCTVTISSGSTWSGTLTPGSSGSGSKTFSPATRSYSSVNSNQIQNFTCSGGGC